MTEDASAVFATATNSMSIILRGLLDWTHMLEGTEREEAIFHINVISRAYHGLTVAMLDHNGGLD